ncbi:iron dicitrate transport regulator FecR [Opitutaceae bacterium TAV5]|nr:iron dicitrate transport regulator FecR [Opitutaceae bacterium TAV5]
MKTACSTGRLAFAAFACLLFASSVSHADDQAPKTFSEAVISEIVNEVSVVDHASLQAQPAQVDAPFRAPDLLRTGRRSRAQLQIDDGTIARVGSSAVFSFEKDSRSIRLKSGTVLFHSPTGKGGGTIITNSVAASVIGTTIMVTATSDGGFKLMVLEGTARVTFPNGRELVVKAGQMTFLMPAADSQAGDPEQGPVLDFDLDALVSESLLVNGFKYPLGSEELIRESINIQGHRIDDGELVRTGLVIIGATSSDDFMVANDADVRQQATAAAGNGTLPGDNGGPPPLSDAERLLANLNSTVVLGTNLTIPEEAIFRDPVEIPEQFLPAGVVSGPVTGILAGTILADGTVELGPLGAMPSIFIGGIVFEIGGNPGAGNNGATILSTASTADNTTTFVLSDPATTHLFLAAHALTIAPGTTLGVSFATPGGTLDLVSVQSLALDSVHILNPDGGINLTSLGGSIDLSGGSITAGGPSYGLLSLYSTQVASPASDLKLIAATGITIDGATLSADSITLKTATGDISVGGAFSFYSAAGPVVITAQTGNVFFDSPLVQLSNSQITAGEDISLFGNTVSVYDSTFTAGPEGSVLLTATGEGITVVNSIFSGASLQFDASDGQSVIVANSTLDASSITLRAGDEIGINGATLDASPGGLVIEGRSVSFNGISAIDFTGATVSGTDSLVVNAGSIHLDGGVWSSAEGVVALTASTGDLTADNTVFGAGDALVATATLGDIRFNHIGAGGSLDIASLVLSAPAGSIDFSTGSVLSGIQAIVTAGQDIAVTALSLKAPSGSIFSSGSGNVSITTTGDLTLKGATLSASAAGKFIDLQGSSVKLDSMENIEGSLRIAATGTVVIKGSMLGEGAHAIGSASIDSPLGSIVFKGSSIGGTATLDAAATSLFFKDTSIGDGALLTLKSRDGLVSTGYSFVEGSVTFGCGVTWGCSIIDSESVYYSGAFYIPALNIGTVESPIHILKLTDTDFRGSKLDYIFTPGRELEFVEIGSGPCYTYPEISNNFLFSYDAPAVLTREQMGLPSGFTLPAGYDTFTGVVAQSIAVTPDSTAFFETLGWQASSYYAREFTFSGDLATFGLEGGLFLAATGFTFDPGTSFKVDVGSDATFGLRSYTDLLLAGVSLTTPKGSIAIESLGNLHLGSGTVLTAGRPQEYDDLVYIQSGGINLTARGNVILNEASLIAWSDDYTTYSTSNSGGYGSHGVTIDTTSNAEANIELTNSTITTSTRYSAGDIDRPAGFITIKGAREVRIDGGRLVAASIDIRAGKQNNDAHRLDVKNLDLTLPEGAEYASVRMEAYTVRLTNVTFDVRADTTINSGKGTVNVNATSTGMLGAVNFYGGVQIKDYQGVSQNLNEAGNFNQYVHVVKGSDHIYNNGTAAGSSGYTGNSGYAPITIGKIGSSGPSL